MGSQVRGIPKVCCSSRAVEPCISLDPVIYTCFFGAHVTIIYPIGQPRYVGYTAEEVQRDN